MQDTSPAMLAEYVERLSALGVIGRVQVLDRLCRDTTAIGLLGLRARHPAATDLELRIRLACLRYGRAAASILGPVPDDAVEPLR